MAGGPSDEVLLAVLRVVMDISVRAAGDLDDVSLVQLRALTVLQASSGANLATLGESMGVTVSTASRLVDRLVLAGRVHRGPSPRTRREVSLTLSETGREILRRYDERRLRDLQRCLARVPGDRRPAVAAAVAELVTAATQVDTAARR